MKRIFFIFSLISLVSFSHLFAQENNASEHGADSAEAFAIIPELEPEESSNLPESKNRVIFKTNVKNCAVYLNNNLQGRTQLTLNNLVDGYYLLRVEKDGYDFQENFVYAEHGKSKTFYIELQPNEETQKREEVRAARSNSAAASSNSENDADASHSSSQTEAQSATSSAQNSQNASFGDAK